MASGKKHTRIKLNKTRSPVSLNTGLFQGGNKHGSFTLSNGKSFDIEGHTGKYLEVLAQRKYLGGPHEGKYYLEMPEEFKESADLRTTKIVPLGHPRSDERYDAEDIYLLAENKAYKEYGPISQYDGPAGCNADGVYTIEVLMQFDEWHKRLILPESYGRGTCFLSMISNIEDAVADYIEEGKLEDQGATYEEEIEEDYEEGPYTLVINTTTGEYMRLNASRKALENAITSVKLVKYDIKIDKREGESDETESNQDTE